MRTDGQKINVRVRFAPDNPSMKYLVIRNGDTGKIERDATANIVEHQYTHIQVKRENLKH